jgi:glycogen synthase
VKTGGLADVAGALPIALKQDGVDVRVVLPKYGMIDEYWKSRMRHVCNSKCSLDGNESSAASKVWWTTALPIILLTTSLFFYVSELYGDGLREACASHFSAGGAGGAASNRILSGRFAPQRLANGTDGGASENAVYRRRGLCANPHGVLDP